MQGPPRDAYSSRHIYDLQTMTAALSEWGEINKKQTWENNKIRGKFASVIVVPNSNWQMLSQSKHILWVQQSPTKVGSELEPFNFRLS